jgi:hypothetical protein
MPGVFEVPAGAVIGRIIEDLLLIADYRLEGEWEGKSVICRCKRVTQRTEGCSVASAVEGFGSNVSPSSCGLIAGIPPRSIVGLARPGRSSIAIGRTYSRN